MSEEKKEPNYDEMAAEMDRKAQAAWAEWAKKDPTSFAKSGGEKREPKPQNSPNHDSDEPPPRTPLAIVLPEEPLEPEEIILEALQSIGVTFPNRPQALTAISKALVEVIAHNDKASATREADGMLKLLYLLGASESREMTTKALTLQAIIARNEEGLSDIAKSRGVTRADISKIGRELKEFLGIEIHTSTRDHRFVEQCRERALRVHEEAREDAARANQINKAA